jgi:hypothetical protein
VEKASQAKKYLDKVACFWVRKFGRQTTTITTHSTTIFTIKKPRSTTAFPKIPLKKRP